MPGCICTEVLIKEIVTLSAPLEVLISQSRNLSKQGLQPFVEANLRQVFGATWLSKADCKKESGVPHWDIQALLKTMILNWPTVFQNILPPSVRGLAFELKDRRNQVAHEHELSLDDVARMLDTAARLLRAIKAKEAAELECLHLTVMQALVSGAQPPSAVLARQATAPIRSRAMAASSNGDRSTVAVASTDGAPSWQICVSRVGERLGTPLVRRKGRCAFSSDGAHGVCCLVSKEYPGDKYWWTIHARQIDDIQACRAAYIALACGTANTIILIPLADFEPWLPYLNPKDQPTGDGWHIHIVHEGSNWYLRLKGRGQHVSVSEYLI